MLIEQSRPRRASQVEEKIQDSTPFTLLNKSTGAELTLDSTALLIWQLCDGSNSTTDIVTLLQETFPEASSIAGDVKQTLIGLVKEGYVVFDGGEAALEYQGEVVRKIQPSVELLWNLEIVRNFLSGALRLDLAKDIPSNLEALLSEEALQLAKDNDVDAARRMNDSMVISYRDATRAPSFMEKVNKIQNEIHRLLPEVESKITLSGNAVYLRGSHMGWHSNHSRADGRIYCSWAELPNTNYFRYEHPLTGEVVTEWEEPGWNIKSFTIPPKPARFWHCIGANSHRISIGFRYDLPNKAEQ